MLVDSRDFHVSCGDPARLDESLRALGAALLVDGRSGEYIRRDGLYLLRCFGDPEALLRLLDGCATVRGASP